ncbi:MAG: hypothetical protein ACI9LE_000519 [Paraglaciecola sp.]|jgi:uncharacterized membrane protein YeiB
MTHVIIGMGMVEAFGLLYGQNIQLSLVASLLFCIASILFSVFWVGRFKTGPLEWIFKTICC